jgi:galactoside O-acetyltransferase
MRHHHAEEWYEPIVVLKPEKVEFGEYCRVDSFVKIEGGEGIRVGHYVHIASFAHVGIGGGSLRVGDEAMIASGAKILTGTNTDFGESMSSSARSERQVIKRYTTWIGPRAFIGAGAIILPGVAIGEGAVIGAGSVVTKNVPSGEVWVGNPARFYRMRRTP